MPKHTIEISEESNLKVKILKSRYGLDKVSDVIERVLSDMDVVLK